MKTIIKDDLRNMKEVERYVEKLKDNGTTRNIATCTCVCGNRHFKKINRRVE